jgi:hypothetical protein
MQLQMGARLAETLTAAEAAAAAAFTRANRRSRAGADGEGCVEEEGRGGWEALFCAQAATSLRLMAADARDGLAACRELGGALEGELGEVSLDGTLSALSGCLGVCVCGGGRGATAFDAPAPDLAAPYLAAPYHPQPFPPCGRSCGGSLAAVPRCPRTRCSQGLSALGR